jgi:hypothetical protein
MKCNLPKERDLPKPWHRLPQHEKNAINKAMTERAYEIVDKEEEEMLEVWIKLNCILLHDFKGFTEEDLFQYIAAWKRIYQRNDRTQNKESQKVWLDAEMKRCFPTCGFPQIRIDELKKYGNE